MTANAEVQRIDLGTTDLKFELEGRTAWLTFNRPQARNAMTWAMYEGLYAACAHVDSDDSVRLLVLRGAGDKAFVAGTDISQFQAFRTEEDALAYERRVNRYASRLETLKKPVIAMIRGYCVGGGAALAMACDLRVASDDTQFGIPIARTLGNTLSAQNLARLVALVGPARTKELLFTARFVRATEGQQVGLFNEVVPAEQLEARTRELAAQIVSHAPLTIRSIKEGVRRLMVHGRIEETDDLYLMCYMSEDFREGVSAFMAKRPPAWKGR
jgi:enoyl-CoA hydratase